jgi:hypothetical protein
MSKKEERPSKEEMNRLYEEDRKEFLKMQDKYFTTRARIGDKPKLSLDNLKENVKKSVKVIREKLKREHGGTVRGTKSQDTGKKFSGIY